METIELRDQIDMHQAIRSKKKSIIIELRQKDHISAKDACIAVSCKPSQLYLEELAKKGILAELSIEYHEAKAALIDLQKRAFTCGYSISPLRLAYVALFLASQKSIKFVEQTINRINKKPTQIRVNIFIRKLFPKEIRPIYLESNHFTIQFREYYQKSQMENAQTDRNGA